MWPFFVIRFNLRSYRSTSYLLTVAPIRIARAFNRSDATQAIALDIFKAFDGPCFCLTNVSLVEFLVRYLALFRLFSIVNGF